MPLIDVDFAVRIPTRSGVTLGATITRPRDPGRYPALVWYDPYRAAWDGQIGATARYFADRGYVFVNLHSRGTGNSEGVSRDEYMAEETEDGVDAIEWLAARPWCSGSVGMLGASYSGFTCLQVAALAPPALKAIAPAYFTDRRYTDDCHYKGGCLRGYYDVLTYGLGMVAANALPPHPKAVGPRWAEIWQQRLEEGEPYLLNWLAHPVEDDYWARGSVIGRYDQIRAACFLIGGWHDGYVNPPLRTFHALTAPKKLLMGPWSHTYPDRSHCGPRIDIHHELLRWWDRWLKGIDNGVDREPKVVVFVQEHEEPIQDRIEIAGTWCAGEEPRVLEGGFRIARTGLVPAVEAPGDIRDPHSEEHHYAYRPGSARNGGIWDAGVPFCLPGEQRPDEALALNYTSQPLFKEAVIFGQPAVTLTVSVDVPVLPLAIRLCDVAEDGTSVLVTKGILNLTRRDGMDQPRPLAPGEPTSIKRFALEATAWRFRPGHRVRLSIDGSDFPNVWPTPLRGTGTVYFGPQIEATLHLPLWLDAESSPVQFLPSPHAPASTGAGGDPPPWRVVHDVLEDRLHFVMASGNEFVISDRDPADAYARARSVRTAAWNGFVARSEASAVLTSDEQSFHLVLSLNLFVNDALHFQRAWRQSTERRLL